MGSLTRRLRRNARPPARGFRDPGALGKVRVLPMGDPHVSQYGEHLFSHVDFSAQESRILASMGLVCEFCPACGDRVICKDLLSHYGQSRHDGAHLVAEVMTA